ncbi:MAG: hypothetical protein OEZ48_09355 [Candidatus Bathyarchaeota archaeon]|nr:hypothetical protein [Candidatus Bathyarchaeota archaeon]
MSEEIVDHVVWGDQNRGGYEISIIARLKGPLVSNVQYILRLEDPQGNTVDYMSNLQGFKEVGELLQALHDFSRLPLYANEKHVDRLEELLTPENIKKFAQIIKSSRLGR